MFQFMISAGAAVIGYAIGKTLIDNLDGDMLKRSAVYAVLSVTALVIGAVFQPGCRVGCIVGVFVLLAGIPVGFLYRLLRGSTRGLYVRRAGKCIKDRSYDDTMPQTDYDLYLPPEDSRDGTYGMILYIHGGGFTGGSKKAGRHWCRYMAAQGYVAVSMDYTVVKPGQTSSLPIMLEQVLTCVTKVKEDCGNRGYILTEMAVTGTSAGGCLAAMYAYGKADISPIPVKFLFQETGPMYFEPLWWGKPGDSKAQAEFLALLLGMPVTAEEVERRLHIPLVESISPACMVREGSVPTLIAYGPRDRVVPAGLKFHLFSALDRHHVPYTYVEFPHSNHGMYSDPKARLFYIQKTQEFCMTYFTHKPLPVKLK